MISPWEADVGLLELTELGEQGEIYMPTPEELAEMDGSIDIPSEMTETNEEPKSPSKLQPDTDMPPLEEFPLSPRNDAATEKAVLIPENLAYLSESWNAEVFSAMYASHVFFRAETGHGQNWIRSGWYIWNGGKWTSSESHTVVNRMTMLITSMSKVAEENCSKDDKKVLNAHIKKSLSRVSIWNSLQIASNSPTLNVKAAKLDANPMLLNLENGTLDTDTLALRPHSPKDYITKQIPIKLDPEATCPRWDQFISEITCNDTALADYIQRAAGYSITGDTSEQVMFVLLGTGNNGKSLFLRVLRDILGDYAKQGTLDLLTSMGIPDGDKANNSVAALQGAYMVTLSETRQNARLQENLVKQLTGGDPVTARNLFENFFEFVPRFKLWLATNHRPVIGDTGIGMWRRLKLIPFNAIIPEKDIDPRLYEKLMSEAPGILNWLVEGLRQWHLRGLKTHEPSAVKLGTQEYQREMDKVQLFLDECTERTLFPTDCQMSSRELYSLYTTWCNDAGEKPLSKRYLGIRLKEKGLQSKKDRHGDRLWLGIRRLEN